MKRYFEFVDAKSSKFWEVWIEGLTLYTRFGKIGANGQTTVKQFPAVENLERARDKAITEKIKKGYVEGEGGISTKSSSTNRETESASQLDPGESAPGLFNMPRSEEKSEGAETSTEFWKAFLPRLLEDPKALSAEEVVNCLIGCLRHNDVEWAPYGEVEALAHRIIWLFPNHPETVLWTTSEATTFISSLSSPHFDRGVEGAKFPFTGVDPQEFVFHLSANGWQYQGNLSEYGLVEVLAIQFGAPTMVLPWSRIAENVVDNGKDQFLEELYFTEEDDEEGSEFGETLFEFYSRVADRSLDLPDDMYEFGYDLGNGFMPRYSTVGRFQAFLDDLEAHHGWGIVYDECCGTCAQSSLDEVRREKGKETPVFITWAQDAATLWGLDGSVYQMAYHPKDEEIRVIMQVAKENGLRVNLQETEGQPDGFIDFESEESWEPWDDESEDEPSRACNTCGSNVADGAKFCPECGSELVPTPKFCSECGAKREGSGKFCTDCGHQH